MKKNIYDTAEAAAEALAGYIVELVNQKQGPFNIAVSGGSTPARLFSVLSDKYGNSVDWNSVRFFWVDERCVPPDHCESNYRMTCETLLDHIAISSENIFRMRGEDDPEMEALRYGELIRKNVPDDRGCPSFDLILLGMGDDGHTASIFPDQIALFDSSKICETAVHPQSGQYRISLTGPVINKGKRVVFFITGAAKKTMMEKVLARDPAYPASRIEVPEGELLYFLDREAAPAKSIMD